MSKNDRKQSVSATTPPIVNIIQSGYLLKKDGKSMLPGKAPSWKRRFLILDNQHLSYLKSDKPDAKIYGKISITEIQAIQLHQPSQTASSTTNNAGNQLWTLDIHTKERIYYLSSNIESDINLWNKSLTAFVITTTTTSLSSTTTTTATTTKSGSAPPQSTNVNNSKSNLNDSQQAPYSKAVNPKRQTTLLSGPIPTISNQSNTNLLSSSFISTTTTTTTTTTTNNNVNSRDDDFGFIVVNDDPQPSKPQQQQTNSLKQTITQLVVNAVAPLKQSDSQIYDNNSHNTTIHSPKAVDKLGNESKVSLCGASIIDYAKNFSTGFITSMVAVSKNTIWTGDSNGNIVTWTASNQLKKGSQWKTHTQSITSLIYNHSQKTVYSSSLDSKICAWSEHFTLLFTHQSRVPIYSMISIDESLLLYAGYSDNYTSLVLLDVNTQTATDIPLNSYIQSLEIEKNLVNAGQQHNQPQQQKKKSNRDKDLRKFCKILKYDDRILIATTHSEIIVWSPWDGEICQVLDVGYQSISAMSVIGNTLWICSLPDSSATSFFTPNLPNVVSLWNLNTLKKKRSFDCTHAITSFSIFNGYVWAINRHHISVYETNSGQGVFEIIELGEDMNYISMYNNECAWVGGNHLFRFRLVDKFMQSLSPYDLKPDVNNWEYMEPLLKRLSRRFKYNYDSRLLDLLLDFSENDQLLVQFHITILQALRYFARNQSYITTQSLMEDHIKLERISNLLQSHIKNRNDPLLLLNTLKTLYYLSSLDKFCNRIPIEFLLKFSTQSLAPSIMKYTMLVILKLIPSNEKLQPSLVSSEDSIKKLKDILEYYYKVLDQTFSATNDDGDLIKHAIIYFLKKLFEQDDKRINELILKKHCVQPIHKIASQTPPTYFSQEAQHFLQTMMSNNSKISEMVGKLGGMVIDNSLGEPTMLIYQLTEPRQKKKRLASRPESSTSGPLTANSPITSLMYTLNSLLHSVQNTTLKTAKITIKEISVPDSFPDMFSERQSIIQLQAIIPRDGFQAHFAVNLTPRDLKIKLQVDWKGFSGEATISDVSLQGIVILGFHNGSAKPHWISFQDDPKIDFKCTTSTLLKLADLILKPALQRIIKSKMVLPNKRVIKS